MDKNKLTKGQRLEQNPFIYNAPVRGMDFYNRDEIIYRLLKETVTGKSQGNVWITGERQVGKTSLLRYIQSKFEKFEKKDEKIQLYGADDYFKAAFIYLNVQDNKSRNDFYRNLHQSMKNFFDFKLKHLKDANKNFINALKYLYFSQKYYIVFLVDEFDAFIENLARNSPESATDFLYELNKLIHGVSDFKNEPKVFACIFAANQTINDLMKENNINSRGSGLILESIELPWFSREQIEELAHQYLENNRIQFSPRELDFCSKMTKGYPYFVQKIFSIMYEQKSRDLDWKAYFSKVRDEYGNSFQETLNGWGGTGMPKRTQEKLKDLVKGIIKNVEVKSAAQVFKVILELLLKM